MLTRMLLASTFLVGISAPAFSADPPQAVAPAAPAADMQGISGTVDLYAGYSSAEPWNTDEYDSGTLIGGAGRANIWLSPAVALQLDAWGEGVQWDDESYSSFGIGGHLAWRDPNSYAFGGLVSFGDAANSMWGNVGIEGQAYFGDFTLYGQAAYLSAIGGFADDGGYDSDGFYVFGEARYFPMPNLMVAAHIAYADIDSNCCGDFDPISWGADVEWQPIGSPVAGFLSYQGSSGDQWDEDIDEWTILAGVKVLFGQESLQANNNYGATFADHNPMYGKTRVRAVTID